MSRTNHSIKQITERTYLLKLSQSSPEEFVEMVQALKQLLLTEANNGLSILIETPEAGLPSFAFMIKALLPVLKHYRNHPKLRVAITIRKGRTLQIAKMYRRDLAVSCLMVPPSQRDKALYWVMKPSLISKLVA